MCFTGLPKKGGAFLKVSSLFSVSWIDDESLVLNLAKITVSHDLQLTSAGFEALTTMVLPDLNDQIPQDGGVHERDNYASRC